MTGSAEKAILANRGMRADANLIDRVAIHTFTQTGVVSHLQIPGRPDTGGRIGMNSFAEFSAKEAQEQTTPSVKEPRRRSIKK